MSIECHWLFNFLNRIDNVNNQIIIPPVAKEVVVINIAKEKTEDKEVKAGPKRKISSLVKGKDSKKPLSVKNQTKFRSNDMVHMFDGMLPFVNMTFEELRDIFPDEQVSEQERWAATQKKHLNKSNMTRLLA